MPKLTWLLPYLRPAPLAVFFLGLSSGFPLALVLATLTYWLSKEGVDKSTVGLFALATLPYAIKFLWSPFIDRMALPVLTSFGQRRSWLWLLQALLVGALAGLALSDPANHIESTALWVLLVAFLSASQDIVIDAYRIEILSDDELAYGSATINFGYRTGLLVSGAGTILLSTYVGWPAAYMLTALMVLPAAITVMIIGEPQSPAQPAVVDEQAGGYFERTVLAPFKAFLRIEGAVLILVFVAIYKIGDALANTMVSPLVVELGFTDQDVVFANKVVGFWALIAGTALGPPLLNALGMAKALFVTGVFMMVTNIAFALLATMGNNVPMLAAVVGIENFASGAGLAVFTTYISGICNLSFSGTHYALLSSLAVIGRTFVAATGGIIATSVGWVWFFVITTVAALPGMALLYMLWQRGYTGDSVRARPQAGKGRVPVSKNQVMLLSALIAAVLAATAWRYLR
ncbi:MAG: MFS transporter [Pseudomonadota bacterium]